MSQRRPEDDARASWGDFGEFGVTSDELAALRPEASGQRERWALDQRLRIERIRQASARKIAQLYHQRVLSGPAYDLLQIELAESSSAPWVEWSESHNDWRIWSGIEQRWHTRSGWETRAQDWLAIDDPERVTRHELHTPHASYATYATYESVRPWHPVLDADPRRTPPPQMRVTPPLWITRKDTSR